MAVLDDPRTYGRTRLSFADTGTGMDADALRRVFEPYFSTKATGTGLGLWISQGLVEAHGGSLTAASTVGEGSTFRFTLPTDAFERELGAEPIGEPHS